MKNITLSIDTIKDIINKLEEAQRMPEWDLVDDVKDILKRMIKE